MNYSLCQFPIIQGCGTECKHNPYFWTNAGCSLRVKVDPDDGKVAIIYHANDDNNLMTKHVQSDSPSYFPVHWNNNLFPSPNNNCDDSPLCEIINESCVCTIGVDEVQVFDEMPTRNQVIEQLDIGSFDPSAIGLNKYVIENNVTMFYEDESNIFKTNSVFKVVDEFGRERLFKNVFSNVKIEGSSKLFSFRNPPHFMNLVDPEARDAYFETDAAIDQYFYHQNTAPFLAVNLIKHFGISNPSPNYILRVSTAFKRGVYSWTSKNFEKSFKFGSGMYGDLAATTASILLDTESRDAVLDVDPTHGSLLEPILKIYKLMRSMEIEANDSEYLLELKGLTSKIGQEAYGIPSVFNFFLPEFQPSGLIEEASLVAPEAQLITGPNVLGLLNGMFSLIKYGMNNCYGGFFPDSRKSCKVDPGDYYASRGRLTYSPNDDSNSDAVINELSTLLTGGRLSPENKQIIKDVYDNESDKAAALIMAQQLIVTSAEFHTSGGTIEKSGAARLKASPPQPSEEPYKAVIFILLAGGFDSFNMLVPRCEPLKTKYNLKRGILALNEDELSDDITVPLQNNQPCSNFAIHHKLPVLHEMYNKEKALFFANTGALDQKWNSTNFKKSTLKLFAHNTMQNSVQKLDHFLKTSGTGVLGRMATGLSKSTGTLGKPYKIGSTSIQGFSSALKIESKGAGTPSQIVVGRDGARTFDPYPWKERKNWRNIDLKKAIDDLNNATSLSSSIFGETWSSNFLKVVEDFKFLNAALSQASITEDFDSESKMSKELLQVAKLIQTHGIRGVDRDLFFVEFGGWDHHSNMKNNIASKFEEFNNALQSFWKEMEHQENEDKVALVATSGKFYPQILAARYLLIVRMEVTTV